MNFHDVSNETITSGIDGPVNTAKHSQFTDVQHPEEVATAAVNSTVHAVASELRKMKEPKLAKLKGGYRGKFVFSDMGKGCTGYCY